MSTFKVPELMRIVRGAGLYDSTSADGNNGAFLVPPLNPLSKMHFKVLASDGGGWEHVSVSIRGGKRCPTWEEMEYIRALFWGADSTVMQLHVPNAQHVNFHPWTLHLWRPSAASIPLPPEWFV